MSFWKDIYITAIELAPEGTGYRLKTRFAKFHNLPELMTIFREVADIKTADMLNLPRPEQKDIDIAVNCSQIQQEMVQDLAERAELIRNKKVKPYEDNMLKITNEGRKLALDQRLMNPNLPDYEESKVNICANNVFKYWDENKEKKLTQLVFCDLSTPKVMDAYKNEEFIDVYNELKKKLMKKGVPEEEIRFIHEADNEAKKKELFAKVRAGDVRVLIGSTSKMGAGTNVQDKLIAIHHLDCAWKPSDLTQRNGRGVRQGNENPEVYVNSYVTEKTFDAYMYQLVAKKQRFISQIMTSKAIDRTMEDVDELTLKYGEVMALATGDKRIIEKTELDTEISKLVLLRNSFLNQKSELKNRIIKYYPEEITRLQNIINSIEEDVHHLEENTKPNADGFSPMVLNGVTYTEKSEAGKTLLDMIKTAMTLNNEYIGEYRGFKMSLTFSTQLRAFTLNLSNNFTYKVNLGSDAGGNIIRINNCLENIVKELEVRKNELSNTYVQLENSKKEVEMTFPKEQELLEKMSRLKELNKELKIDEVEIELLDDEEVENKEKFEMQPCR